MRIYNNTQYNNTPYHIKKTIVLVGLMGSGKTTVGMRLAEKLNKVFWDSDQEVEKVAGAYHCSPH